MAGLQSVTTPVTGTGISSTTFGIPVANNLTVLANPPIARLRNSGGQSIPNNTSTAMTWDTEDFDTVSGHSTVTNTSRYTCQSGYAGKYLVRATCVFPSNGTGTRLVSFAINGTEQTASGYRVAPTAGVTCPVASEMIVTLAVGDYVEAWAFQDSGGALTTSTSSAPNTGRFEVQWIHQ